MVTKTYKQDPEGFKRAWLDENTKKGIRIEFPEFKERVRPVGTENPKSLGWYEHKKKERRYVLTNDMSVVSDKAYFKNASEPLVYTDDDIENDSFSLKKSIQSGNNADFIGCISSTLKFKVYNDFFYLKDQKITATLNTLEKAGSQNVTGPLGSFRVGNEYDLPSWDIERQDCVYEINQLGVFGTTFEIGNASYLYNEYLEQCRTENVGLSCHITIPDSLNDIFWEMKYFTGTVEEVKLDKAKNLTREITAYDYMHKLADDYDVTDWYVWQYGDSNADNAQTEIQQYSSYQYLPYEGKENILYLTLDTGNYYKWTAQPYLEDPDEPAGYYTQTSRNFRTRTIKQLRDSFWQFICNEGTVYDPTGQALKQKGEGFSQVRNVTLVNDNTIIPKTLNVSPVDFDQYISGSLVGGPFERHPKTKTESGDYNTGTQYDVYTVSGGWNVSDLVARKQIIELGLVGTLFSYNGKTETHYREYMDDCDNNGAGITASIKIPREEQEKLRETQITAATVLQCICQYNGVFGQFNADGEFEYIKLDVSNPYEIEDEYQIEVGYSDTRMPSITGVVIFDKTSEEYSADNIQTEYGEVKNGKKGTALAYYPDDRTKIEGPDSHAYIIDDNFLFNAFDQVDAINVCKTLYNQITGITVRNANLTIKAMPWLKCGECIAYYAPTDETLYPRETLAPSENLAPADYEHIISLIMTYEISGTGLFKGKIECDVEDVSNQIVNLNEVISAEMFYRKVGDNRSYSEFQQTANQIMLSVTDRERRLKSYIDVRADSIELEVSGPGGAISRIEILQDEIDIQSQRILLEAGRIDAIASEQVNIQSQLITLNAKEITLEASKVSFVDLATGGRTTIEGSNIKTGSITGKQIAANSISCDRIALGAVTIDGETYTMEWRKTLCLDTYRTATATKLGLTIRPNNRTTIYYLHCNKTTINGVDVVTGIDINQNVYGADASFSAVNDTNIYYESVGAITEGYLAYGAKVSGGTTPTNVYWPERLSTSSTAYRLILASEDRAPLGS